MRLFPYWREMTARYASEATACGTMGDQRPHRIEVGDRIGYCRSGRDSSTMCSACWAVWVEENREAEAMERGDMPCCW